ncbi:hypothetical protein [Xylophilus ampelinus]|uniref:Uncharacterized protein n=1 Tax=Xylophilus ampelinus TaxID=54067 RepID=A0A318SIW3_9BURK|nr:hypothetical protein [Xylophilus ampelinus]MCS4509688.1 hypothetical protein [Xylophilus ampelinus]PYE78826.1 hypothetical protein DFQ15_10418 [Xylophilus ampelinus]
MTRCARRLGATPAPPLLSSARRHAAGLALLCCAWGACFSLQAQTAASMAAVRNFPETAMRGQLRVTYPPVVLMDGRPDRLSVGGLIRDTQGRAVLSATLAEQDLTVNYRRDAFGEIAEVWLLTPEEAALRPGKQRSLLESLFGS